MIGDGVSKAGSFWLQRRSDFCSIHRTLCLLGPAWIQGRLTVSNHNGDHSSLRMLHASGSISVIALLLGITLGDGLRQPLQMWSLSPKRKELPEPDCWKRLRRVGWISLDSVLMS